MRRLIIILVSALLLTACAPGQSVGVQPTQEAFVTATLPPTNVPLPTSNAISVTATPTTDPSIFAQLFPSSNVRNELTRKDEQGMVIVEVTPLNLGSLGNTLDFNVSLDTHSVDLSMDLARLATIITDSGIVIQASLWDAPRGGHHVSGTLSFPASVDGNSILDGTAMLRMEIRNVDAELRTFEWTLTQ